MNTDTIKKISKEKSTDYTLRDQIETENLEKKLINDLC